MIRVAILALDNVLPASVMGPLDVFCQTGATWNLIAAREPVSYFDVSIVTQDGCPVLSRNRSAIHPAGGIHDIDTPDLIMVASFSSDRTLAQSGPAVEWLQRQYASGACLAGICAGAYILAETGLLDGKTATTHWGFANDFRQRYPRVLLKSDRIITDEGDLLCSGGCNSYLDLSMYLVERYCGREIALESAKAMIHDIGRDSQTPYAAHLFSSTHRDEKIKQVEEWIRDNARSRMDMRQLARDFGFSRRVFERRFKAATGESPLRYLQQVRVEMAKTLLEENRNSFDEIAHAVGYEDTSFFRKIFKKHTRLLPKEYRARFCRERGLTP